MKSKFFAVLFVMLFPLWAVAGAYEDLEEALLRNDSAAVVNLIERGIDINTVDRQGNTLLIQSVQRDLMPLFDYLLQHRARLNMYNQHGETALSLAAYQGKEAYARRLIEEGAELNYYGWAPLSYAAFNGHTSIAEYLLQHGADVNGITGNGSSALFFAARSGHIDTVRLLLKYQADPNIINENNETAVDWALKGKNTDIESILRKAGGRSGQSVTLDIAK